MSYLYNEIRYAAWLLHTDKNARTSGQTDGQIAPSVAKKIKSFLANTKTMFQKINLEHGHNRKSKTMPKDRHGKIIKKKDFYIKSFFYDVKADCLVLYCRICGIDTEIRILPRRNGTGICPIGHGVTEKAAQFLEGICAYWIPSESSFENHKAINLMPAWRKNPNAA